MQTMKPATEGTSTIPSTSRKSPPSRAVGRRRALLGVVAAGAVGVTALAVPQIRNTLEQDAEALGRQALAHELASLEGVTLDEAIQAAEITKAAVLAIVVPLAKLVATIGGDGLAVLLASLTAATNLLASLHITVGVLSSFRDTVASWHTNISSLPIALTSYTTANLDNGETYLKTLKKHLQS
ncbi:MAG: hypothetical protein ACLQUY_14180 [Ktedonobacterales bacterium]